MFRYLHTSVPDNNQKQVRVSINGRELEVPAESSVWAAMAANGETTTRLSAVSQQPRSAYCAMGACFECLVVIDGVPDQQACMKRVVAGMQIRSQLMTEPEEGLQSGEVMYEQL